VIVPIIGYGRVNGPLSATAISISPRQTAESAADVEYDPAFAAPAKIQDRLLLGNAMLGQFIMGFAARSFVVALSTIANTLHADILGISWAIIAYQLAWIYNQRLIGVGVLRMKCSWFFAMVERHRGAARTPSGSWAAALPNLSA
jgi:hypothetical protein